MSAADGRALPPWRELLVTIAALAEGCDFASTAASAVALQARFERPAFDVPRQNLLSDDAKPHGPTPTPPQAPKRQSRAKIDRDWRAWTKTLPKPPTRRQAEGWGRETECGVEEARKRYAALGAKRLGRPAKRAE